MLIDVHCHIHEADYPLDADETLRRAHENGVDKVICVGTSEDSSRLAIEFAGIHPEAFASIGVHPHEAKHGYQSIRDLIGSDRLVAIGEIGLDYFYDNSPREVQKEALKWQIQLALDNNLPIIFHVRDAFDDFWPIFDSFQGIRGEIHSFTDNQSNLDQALDRGLYVGVNGISTFTRDDAQKAVFNSIPLDKLLIETDAPLLTPVPFRGKVNEPAFVKNIAEFHAVARGISIEQVELATTANAHALFAL